MSMRDEHQVREVYEQWNPGEAVDSYEEGYLAALAWVLNIEPSDLDLPLNDEQIAEMDTPPKR